MVTIAAPASNPAKLQLHPPEAAGVCAPVLGSVVTSVPSVLAASPRAASSGSSGVAVVVGTNVAVAVAALVGVADAGTVPVAVGVVVFVGVAVAVLVGDGVAVFVAVGVGVSVAVAVGAAMVVTSAAETHPAGSEIVWVTKTSMQAWLVKLAPTVSGAATTNVTVPFRAGSCGPSDCPNPVIVTVPLVPTAGVVALQLNEQVTDTKVNGALIASVMDPLTIGRPLCCSTDSSIVIV
jgi:hypothetical protein